MKTIKKLENGCGLKMSVGSPVCEKDCLCDDCEPLFEQTKQICEMIEGLQRWDAVEMKVGVGMKKSKKGYFIEYYELLSKIRGEE